MTRKTSTADRILDAAQALFNEKGFASTTLTEIARSISMSQGNLTYHFPTKRALVDALRARAEHQMQERWARQQPGSVAEDYIDHLLFAMRLTWEMRFLLMDYALITGDESHLQGNPFMQADYAELSRLLQRIREEDLFRADLEFDLEVISRTLWLSSRYWMDHLRELESEKIDPAQALERGIRNHMELLGAFLTSQARKEFSQTLRAALRFSNLTD